MLSTQPIASSCSQTHPCSIMTNVGSLRCLSSQLLLDVNNTQFIFSVMQMLSSQQHKPKPFFLSGFIVFSYSPLYMWCKLFNQPRNDGHQWSQLPILILPTCCGSSYLCVVLHRDQHLYFSEYQIKEYVHLYYFKSKFKQLLPNVIAIQILQRVDKGASPCLCKPW